MRNSVEDRVVPPTYELMMLSKCPVFFAVSRCVEYPEGTERFRTYTSFCRLPLYVCESFDLSCYAFHLLSPFYIPLCQRGSVLALVIWQIITLQLSKPCTSFSTKSIRHIARRDPFLALLGITHYIQNCCKYLSRRITRYDGG